MQDSAVPLPAARPRRWRRVAPWAALVGLLIVAQSLLVWLTINDESSRAQEQVEEAAATAAADIKQALARDQQTLLALLWNDPAPAQWRADVARLLQTRRALLRVEPRNLCAVERRRQRRGDNGPMALGEFDLIARYFTRSVQRAALGVGDDCALFATSPGMQLAVSSDMLVEGRHFVSTVAPDRLGHKALAVNLSDLAACGAKPLAFTLALAMPRVDEVLLDGFSRGLLALADRHGCELIGGDTTQGPLNLCITVFGEVPTGAALLRSGAKPGDDLYVSGTLGDARLALEVFRGSVALDGAQFEAVRCAMETPQPRVELGLALRGIASSAIDVSDGLLGDLGHILRRSGVGATLNVDALPRSNVLDAQPLARRREFTLAGGDDYELVFSAAASQADAVNAAAREAGVAVTRFGRIDAADGLRLADADGRPLANGYGSFDHFKT